MSKEILGKDVVDYWKVEPLVNDYYPKIVILVFGNNPASAIYVKNKEKQCSAYGIGCITHHIAIHEKDHCGKWLERAKKIIGDANVDKFIVGIMVQLPLPEEYAKYEQELIDCIIPTKDIDGLTTTNMGKLLTCKFIDDCGEVSVPSDIRIPATARGICRILKYIDGGYMGKKAVVIGRSNIVGRPVAILLDRIFNMSVTILHSKSKDYDAILKDADVVVTATGVPMGIKGEQLKEGAIVIDAGTSYIQKDGKNVLVGDVDYNSALPVCSAITPVPGGVGVVTVHSLIHNILDPIAPPYSEEIIKYPL